MGDYSWLNPAWKGKDIESMNPGQFDKKRRDPRFKDYYRVVGSYNGFVLVERLKPVPKPAPTTPTQTRAEAVVTTQYVAPPPSFTGNGGNILARLGAPIPVQYGTLLVWPELIAPIFIKQESGLPVSHQLYCLGQGEFSISDVYLNDEPIAQYAGAAYSVVAPHGAPPYYPTNYKVSGQIGDTLTASYSSTYIVNGPGTQSDSIVFTLLFPHGLHAANLQAASVSVVFERQEIDDDDLPLDSWTVLGTETITAANADQFYKTFEYSVTAGRYQVRLKRTAAEAGGSTADRVAIQQIGASRTYHPDYGHVTLIDLKVTATTANQSPPRLSVKCTRKIPVWNGSVWTTAATRSIVWAIADMVRAEYGANMSDAVLDKAALLTLDGVLDGRGDYCDVRFFDPQTVHQAIDTVARLGRLKCFIAGGKLIVKRDTDPAGIYVAMFTPLEMAPGSFAAGYSPAGYGDSDSVAVEYLDVDDNKIRSVTATLNTSTRPETLRLTGCTSRDQAWREGMYWRATRLYRRQNITFNTWLEGRIVQPYDTILVCHDQFHGGQWGQLYEIGSGILTLSNPVDFGGENTGELWLRDSDGSPAGPLEVTPTANPYQVAFTDALPSGTFGTVVGDTRSQRTSYCLSLAAGGVYACKVIAPRPSSYTDYQIECVVDSADVYTADTGTVPSEPLVFDLSGQYTAPSPAAPTPPVQTPVQQPGGTGGFSGVDVVLRPPRKTAKWW